jgi:alpha-tubulin suppressor-like RCC1 family protein
LEDSERNEISFPKNKITNIYSSNMSCSCFIKTDNGDIYAFGYNNHCQLFLGNASDKEPVTIIPFKNIENFYFGYHHNFFINS